MARGPLHYIILYTYSLLSLDRGWGPQSVCHHHGPQGKDPYPAEGAKGCPSESSPQGPKKCDAGATGVHASFKSDKYKYTGKTQSASGVASIQKMIMEARSEQE